YNSVMARGDVVIANSRYTADLIHRVHPEQAGDRVRVIHRGTDLAVFNPVAVGAGRVEALRRAWNVAPHGRVILLAARLTAWKGQRVLIEAAAQMRDRGMSDIAVVLAGDPQGRTSYERE
ncbi:glycosyltransferase family 4 protein, partial|nr:glycosyltransferase family 4 protein [Escherichia coli]